MMSNPDDLNKYIPGIYDAVKQNCLGQDSTCVNVVCASICQGNNNCDSDWRNICINNNEQVLNDTGLRKYSSVFVNGPPHSKGVRNIAYAGSDNCFNAWNPLTPIDPCIITTAPTTQPPTQSPTQAPTEAPIEVTPIPPFNPFQQTAVPVQALPFSNLLLLGLAALFVGAIIYLYINMEPAKKPSNQTGSTTKPSNQTGSTTKPPTGKKPTRKNSIS